MYRRWAVMSTMALVPRRLSQGMRWASGQRSPSMHLRFPGDDGSSMGGGGGGAAALKAAAAADDDDDDSRSWPAAWTLKSGTSAITRSYNQPSHRSANSCTSVDGYVTPTPPRCTTCLRKHGGHDWSNQMHLLQLVGCYDSKGWLCARERAAKCRGVVLFWNVGS
jgi:hypothetical protein